MKTINVQFEDETLSRVRGVFGCRQDENYYPHQGSVDETDPRYLDWLSVTNSPSAEEQIATERYNREGVGITVDGSVFDTTRDGQALIAGAAVSAILDPTYTCNWKTGSGFVELTASQLIGIATAVRAHVQACFDRELTLLRALESGEYKTDMLIEGWPDSPNLPDETPSSAA